jgi:hypothetical protein
MATLVFPRSIPTPVPSGAGNSETIGMSDTYRTTVVDYLQLKVYDSSKGNQYTNIGATGVGALLQTIYLYLPQGLKEEYGAEYARTTLGAAGLGLVKGFGAIQGGGATTENLVATLQQTAGAAKPEFLMNAVGSAIGTVNSALGLAADNLDANSIAALTTNKIFNPYQETTFRGSSYRSHQFNFKCAPRNVKEAQELYSIINILRMAMLPGTSSDSGIANLAASTEVSFGDAPAQGAIAGDYGGGYTLNDRWLSVPSYFRASIIRVEGKVNETGDIEMSANQPSGLRNIMQFPTNLVLTNMSIDLTPDGPYNSLKDAQDSVKDYGPASMNINLAFDETAFLTRDVFNGGRRL